MNSHPSDPSLTPEEREFAQRLSRLGGTREPSPALDTRVLAAAHDAVHASTSASASKRRRSQRRWPVGLGVAASLALAVGIAWQLRPVPDAAVEYSEAPTAVQDAASVAGAPDAATANRADVATGEQARVELRQPALAPPKAAPAPESPAERKQAPEPAREARAAAASEADAREQAEAGFTPTPQEPAIVFDDPSPVDSPAPVAAPVAPPPPPAPPSPAELRLPTASPPAGAAAGASTHTDAGHDETRKQRARSAAPRQESSAAAEAEAASALDRVEVSGSRVGYDEDQPLDDRPPASADSPQVRQAWLQRIRELVARGQFDDARASLAEYRRRYPDQPLPDDLRALDE